MPTHEEDAGPVSTILYDVVHNNPELLGIDLAEMSPEVLAEIAEVMQALGRLREAEHRLTDASQRYMNLGRSDMRALHFLIVAGNASEPITPSAIAAHLGISTASTTKLLDRLESSGHIVRTRHPHDRRALAITVTPETRAVATQTVGRLQAKRFHAAANLDSAERASVVRFLDDMTARIDVRTETWAAEAYAAARVD